MSREGGKKWKALRKGDKPFVEQATKLKAKWKVKINGQGMKEAAVEGGQPDPVWLTVNKIECGQDSVCENGVFVVGDHVMIAL